MTTLSLRRIVVKLGTNVLTAGTDRLNRPLMIDLVRQLVQLRAAGIEMALVSSGAVAAGWERLGFPPRRRAKAANSPNDPPSKQVLGAVGQSRLMHLYEQLFDIYDVRVAQALLTRDDVRDRQRYLNARNTLLGCIAHGIMPIINENDALATEGSRLGNNDILSALTANLIDADTLVILSDIDGLYTADPRRDPKASMISVVPQIDDYIWSVAGGSGTKHGTGGMATKIQAATLAVRSGVGVVITSGREPNILLRLAQGDVLGTRFLARESHLESRKRWLLAEAVPQSRVIVDAGAVAALLSQGKSLLPAGVTNVDGEFERGDTVRIFDTAGKEIARGLSQYRADELRRIKGLHSSKIHAVLGYAAATEVVHRDDMVVL